MLIKLFFTHRNKYAQEYYQQFFQTTQSFPEKTSVISGNDSYSYKDLLLYSESIAIKLQNHIKPGENIVSAIKQENFEIISVANQQIISWLEVYKLFTKISGIELTIINKNDWIRNIIHKADQVTADYLYKLIPLYTIQDENSAKDKVFELTGEIKSSVNYEEIIKSYICAIQKTIKHR